MKLRLLLAGFPGSSLIIAFFAKAKSPSYLTAPHGAILLTDPLVTGMLNQ